MALSYIGGKSKIGKWIVPFIPKDIETYVEPFSGMFWVFFNMELKEYPKLKKVVYNDFNPLNYNLFKCLNNPDKLLEECEKIEVQKKGVIPTNPICEQQFVTFQSEIFSKNLVIEEFDYVIAAKYAYVLSQVFSGANPEKSKFIDLKGKYHSKFTSFKNKLKKSNWIEHFLKITEVENLDFQDVIEKYDSLTSYFYTDPPYYVVGEGSYYSNHDFARKDHERLANTLKGIQGKFSLSYYDFDLLHTWFPEEEYTWVKKEFVKAAAATKGKTQNKGEELLIMNY
jgi:DNA adenine methylase